MDAFLLSYGLDPVEARRLFSETGAVLSGSSALALYLKQEGVEAGFEPKDIDLWLDGSNVPDAEAKVELLLDFFVRSRYYMARETRQANQYAEHLTRIHRIVTVESQHPVGKTIQLIVVLPRNGGSVHDYIASQFDFSACMTWWDEEKEEFYTMYPSLTKAKQMFVRRNRISAIHEVRSKERMEKYLCRGFTVVDEPPPFWFTPDERGEEDVAVWGEVQAFDVLAYEEKNAKEHLRMGDWFVLIGCGETWYAYDRRPLITYMEEHGGVHAGERGLLYDTPYRQTVIHEAWDAFAYSDYSVYELVEPEVISVRVKGREETKTLYGVRAYSVAEWRAGEAGYVVGKQTEARREEEKEEAVAEEDVAEEAGEGLLDALQGLLAEEEVIPDSPPLPDDIASVLVVSTEEFYRQLLNWIQVDRR